MDETWRSLVEFPGYEVSDLGRVRSWKPARRGAAVPEEPRMLKATINRGYEKIRLSTACGGAKTISVHRLILEAFVGPAPEGAEACHGNGLRSDNRLTNLRWDTRRNNHRDKVAHGTLRAGDKVPSHKLTEADVVRARQLASEGVRMSVLAKEFGVYRGTVRNAVSGRTWAAVSAPAVSR